MVTICAHAKLQKPTLERLWNIGFNTPIGTCRVVPVRALATVVARHRSSCWQLQNEAQSAAPNGALGERLQSPSNRLQTTPSPQPHLFSFANPARCVFFRMWTPNFSLRFCYTLQRAGSTFPRGPVSVCDVCVVCVVCLFVRSFVCVRVRVFLCACLCVCAYVVAVESFWAKPRQSVMYRLNSECT